MTIRGIMIRTAIVAFVCMVIGNLPEKDPKPFGSFPGHVIAMTLAAWFAGELIVRSK